jgi:hypothetical protein
MRSVTALHKLRNVSSAKLACLCLRIRIPPRRDVFSERRHLVGNFITLQSSPLSAHHTAPCAVRTLVLWALCNAKMCRHAKRRAGKSGQHGGARETPVLQGECGHGFFLLVSLSSFDLTHSLSRRGRPSILPATLYTLTH